MPIRMHAYKNACLYLYKAVSEAEKYNKLTSLTFADVCMLYFEIEVSQTQGQSKSESAHSLSS